MTDNYTSIFEDEYNGNTVTVTIISDDLSLVREIRHKEHKNVTVIDSVKDQSYRTAHEVFRST